MRSLALILRADPHLTAVGEDHPDRLGFENSRTWLEADELGFETARRWLQHGRVRTRFVPSLVRVIQATTRRRCSPGAVIAAGRSLGLRLTCPPNSLQRAILTLNA